MSVSGRARQLKKDVLELDGVLEIDINYIQDTVSVRYDSSKVTLAEIKRTVAQDSART